MALPLKEAFTARAIGTVWDQYKASLALPPYLGRSLFGTQKKMGLNIKYILGEDAVPRALKGSNFGAEAPLRDGIGFSDVKILFVVYTFSISPLVSKSPSRIVFSQCVTYR